MQGQDVSRVSLIHTSFLQEEEVNHHCNYPGDALPCGNGIAQGTVGIQVELGLQAWEEEQRWIFQRSLRLFLCFADFKVKARGKH